MRQAFYRQYRPQKLGEVVGQEHITTTLGNAIKKGALSHAYLLTGPRGVGKTSIARIMAHEINGLPYKADQLNLDIIEIDAASNRRIDEIRELRDKVHVAPVAAKYKVYIIDEVHMLTREAFNALLKTLEEPPEHVVFILATTEPHKVPETIASRTQHFSFKAVSDEAIAKHLEKIAKQEKLEVEPEALSLIAAHGQGSFRDSIGLLDQLSSADKNITAEQVRSVIGLPTTDQLDKLLKHLLDQDTASVIEDLQELKANGDSAAVVAKQFSARLRETIIKDPNDLKLLSVIDDLLAVPASLEPYTSLEIALLKYCIETEKAKNSEPALVATPAISAPTPKVIKTDNKPVDKKTSPAKLFGESLSGRAKNGDPWLAVLAQAKSKHNSLYSVLRIAQVTVDGQLVTLGFQFPFHAKQIKQDKNMTMVRDLVFDNFGKGTDIKVEISADYQEPVHSLSTAPKESKTTGETDKEIANISNIFGSAELLD